MRRWIAASVAAGLLAIGCGSSGSSPSTRVPGASTAVPDSVVGSTSGVATTSLPPKVYAPGTFDRTDQLLDQRVRAAGLTSGVVKIVAADGGVIHEHAVGGMSGSTPLGIASSTKWFTAATFMTFVDRGAIGLDDDISRWLPEFAGSVPPITARQLLDHTSGVHDNPCQNDSTALAVCVRILASSPREFAAGSRFSYGNAPFLVVGRLVEVLGAADFATVARQRLTSPLGMNDTTWPGAPGAANPAFGVRVTVDDYGRFLDMILHDGTSGGARVLSHEAIVQLTTNQVAAYDTTRDYSVGITRIPRYGLGCWLDVQDAAGHGTVVSGNGGKGFYPWVDFTTRTWGIVGVQDERGAELAVPASQTVEVEARTAAAR